MTLGPDIVQAASTQTGCGIKVAVVDSGTEIGHEDLAANVVAGASYNFVTNGVDPTPADPTAIVEAGHGTSVAGLIGAVAGNSLGGRGVAGQASLVGYNFLAASPQTIAQEVDSLGGQPWSADVDVFNQSYGATLTSLDPTVEAQLKYGVTSLRGGNGAIYVKAAGNSFGSDSNLNCTLAKAVPGGGISCMDASLDGENTTPYNIVVGALNSGDGSTAPTKSSYSTAGSALWISAPGGEFGVDNSVSLVQSLICGGPCPLPDPLPAIITTDQSGCSGGFAVNFFNGETTLNWFNYANGNSVQTTYNSNCNYTSTFNGTSSATPVTSGAIAVLLSAKPSLTWRDVKYILAATATKVDSSRLATTISCNSNTFTAVPAWANWTAGNAPNAAFNFHPWYGFGKVNLDAAVTMAGGFTPNGFGTASGAAMTDTGWQPSLSTFYTAGAGTIPNCSTTGATLTTQTPAPTVSFIEAVQVNVCFGASTNLGEVQLVLKNVSNSATSVILPGQNGLNGISITAANVPTCQVFLTNAFYGMSSASGFSLTAYDTGSTGSTPANSLYGWQIRVYGH